MKRERKFFLFSCSKSYKINFVIKKRQNKEKRISNSHDPDSFSVVAVIVQLRWIIFSPQPFFPHFSAKKHDFLFSLILNMFFPLKTRPNSTECVTDLD